MNFKKTTLIVLLFLIWGSPAMAEIYEPGTGILLPKRKQDKQNEENQKRNQPVQKLNNRNSDTKIVKDGAVVQPNQSAPLIVQPSRSNNTSDNAQKLTNAYAAHLYTGVCSQEYRDSLAAFTEPNLDRRKMWADIQASCKCLTNEIMTEVPATDLADYVMYTQGAQKDTQLAPEVASYYTSGKSGQIQQLSLNGQIRKKCGFLN